MEPVFSLSKEAKLTALDRSQSSVLSTKGIV
jgi:hypothetical protein